MFQFYKTTQKLKDLCKISAIYTEKDKKIQSIDRKKKKRKKNKLSNQNWEFFKWKQESETTYACTY
jgi:hypothetical protein